MASVLFLLASGGFADASSERDFVFYFSVGGYDANNWFGEPSALALDEPSGLIYVADTKTGMVDAFSLQGIAKFRYGTKNGLKAPLGLAVNKRGDLYISENDGGPIKIVNSKGEITTLDLPAVEGAEPVKPGRMTMDRDDNLYVVDRANCLIHVFDRERKLKFSFGGIGDRRGQFKMLEDVGVDRQGRIYALDSLGVPVQVFDMKGGYITRFGNRGEGQRDLSFPTGIFLDRHDQMWVVDRTQHCLKVFDRSGFFLRSYGAYGQGEGSLFLPVDATIDSFGRVYVLEAGARRLQVFTLSRPYEPFSPQVSS